MRVQVLLPAPYSRESAGAPPGQTADYRLFQNHGKAYKGSKAIHDFFNVAGFGGTRNGATRQGGFGLGDVVNTYPGVPANLGVKALEYSPANVIKGGAQNGKTLLVIKDSFANSLAPFLTADYENILMLDLRYFNGSVKNLVSSGVTDIMFVGEMSNVAKDENLFKLLF